MRVFDNTKIDNELTVGQDSTLNGNVFLNNTFGNTTIDGVTFIKNQLQVILGDKLSLDFKEDKKIIGGLVIKVGSKMIDSSLSSRINKLKIAMKGA